LPLAEIDEEIRFHLENRTEFFVQRGMTHDDAERAAADRFGDINRIRSQCYAIDADRSARRSHEFFRSVARDVRYALRTLRKNPGFTVIAVSVLALGIGADAAIFSLVNAVLLRPLPYANPGGLVMLWERGSEAGRPQPMSPPTFAEWREPNPFFEAIAVVNEGSYNLAGGNEPERVPGAHVSPRLFTMLGVNAVLGRVFLSEEGAAGGEHVAMLGYGLWRRRFGSNRQVIGKSVTLDGEGYLVVGVLPPGFDFPSRAEVWTPVALGAAATDESMRGARYLRVVARLRADVTVESAQAGVDGLAFAPAGPRQPDGRATGLIIIPLHEHLVGDVRLPLLVLVGAVSIVLLIACANIANLQLVRGVSRKKEIAIRAALGASRRRLVHSLLIESMLLSLLAGTAGLLLAVWATHLMLMLGPVQLPRGEQIGVDATVIVFAAVVSLLTGTLFGFFPALRLSNIDINQVLKDEARRGARHRGFRIYGVFVVSQIALAVVLLIGAGLMIQTLTRLLHVEQGFDTANILTARIALPPADYVNEQQQGTFYRVLVERLEALPLVQSAGAVTNLPMSGTNMLFGVQTHARDTGGSDNRAYANYRATTPGYFRALGIPLLRGRPFTARDTRNAPPVVIINEAFARTIFPSDDPLGKQIAITYGDQPWREIVGVVGDVTHFGLDTAPRSEMYVPQLQNPWPFMTLVVRAEGNPQHLVTAIREEVAQLDEDQPVYEVRTMDQVLSRSIAQPRFYATVLGVFASVAILLAALGVYGVMSYAVSQRHHELGIRMALGADRTKVLTLIFRQGVVLTLVGVSLGTLGAFALSRTLESMLFDIDPTDPATFAGVAGGVIIVALCACLLPARQTAGVTPMVALRSEK
jgi:putative ABC transport system permease protein